MPKDLSETHCEYRVTFGHKYAHEPHPTFSEAHPNGWYSIFVPIAELDDYGLIARREAFNTFGGYWAFIYMKGMKGWDDVFDPELFHKGELGRSVL